MGYIWVIYGVSSAQILLKFLPEKEFKMANATYTTNAPITTWEPFPAKYVKPFDYAQDDFDYAQDDFDYAQDDFDYAQDDKIKKVIHKIV
jgi:hypothetical protein